MSLNEWLSQDNDEKSRKQIQELAKSDRSALKLAMSPRIAFGTAGLRAEMGPGYARINNVTVLQASQGLAAYAKSKDAAAPALGVVVGHDHRHNSAEFAKLTASAFAKLGFKLHFLGLCHTPLVPFAIDHYGAACGVMITASHNPAKDNGYKVYWSNGCQIIPPLDMEISQCILENLKIESWELAPEVAEAVARPQAAALAERYFAQLPPARIQTSSIKYVYTAMHGVGLPYATRALDLLGVPKSCVSVVEKQAHPDPDFPTVKFPNPEEKGALDLAIAQAKLTGANYVLANDPDADRFSCAYLHNGEWHQLNGDEIGTLLADYLLRESKSEKKAVLNSAVSSQALKFVAKHYGAYFDETLTGFKWLGNRAIELEKEGYDVVLAYEEAIGFACGCVHDKDGVSALHAVVRMLDSIESSQSNVPLELERIYSTVGYFAQHNSYYRVASAEDKAKIFAFIRSVINVPIDGWELDRYRDLTTGFDSSTENNRPTLHVDPNSNMLTFWLENKNLQATARITARESGTEPKLKVYVEAKANTEPLAVEAASHLWDSLGASWFKSCTSA